MVNLVEFIGNNLCYNYNNEFIILVNKYRKIKEKNLIIWYIKKGCSIKYDINNYRK